MFSFIHTYTPVSFPGLTKSGLWRSGDGLKLMHKPGFLPPDDFNAALAPEAPLYGLLRELKCPFYLDRLQGGVGYTKRYPYDPAITENLLQTLGDRFLGFQMHEWASNLRSDMQRIEALFRQEGAAIADPAAWRMLWRQVINGELQPFLEAYPAKEWIGQTPFSDLGSFLRAADALYARRAVETQGLLFPADSYFMAPRTEIKNGAKLLLPEIGWQIPDMRIQLAFTRGMANAAGIPWGVYYECWQDTKDTGFTIPFSLREGQDEWLEDLLHKGNGHTLPPERREHGGSSLSLAARAWRLAYFSSASYIAEEYGVCNTFRELEDFSLSPYGEMKRDFLRFTEAFPDPGAPYTPIAVVLPKALGILEIPPGEHEYLKYPCTDPACPLPPERLRRFKAQMETIFGTAGQHGNYGHILKNGGLPAVCDILYEDMPEALGKYEHLIDLTESASLAGKYTNVITAVEADRLLDALLPCRIGGGLFTAYNRCGEDWFVLVMNNNGIFHDAFTPDVLLPEATVRVAIQLKDTVRTVTKAAGNGALHPDGGKPQITLHAGEWLLLKLNLHTDESE